jgi:hypothetical protein
MQDIAATHHRDDITQLLKPVVVGDVYDKTTPQGMSEVQPLGESQLVISRLNQSDESR